MSSDHTTSGVQGGTSVPSQPCPLLLFLGRSQGNHHPHHSAPSSRPLPSVPWVPTAPNSCTLAPIGARGMGYFGTTLFWGVGSWRGCRQQEPGDSGHRSEHGSVQDACGHISQALRKPLGTRGFPQGQHLLTAFRAALWQVAPANTWIGSLWPPELAAVPWLGGSATEGVAGAEWLLQLSRASPSTACDLGAAHCTTSHSLLPCGGAGGGWDVGMLRGLVTARPLLQESSVLLSVAAGWSAYGCGVPDLGAAPHSPKDVPWCHQDKDRSKTCSVLGSKQMARAQPRHGCSIPMDCTGLGIPNRALIPDLLPPQLSIPFLPAAAGNPGDAPSSTQHLTPNSHPWEATSVPCPGDTEVVSISFNEAVAWGRRI